jgi:hypothetical protein
VTVGPEVLLTVIALPRKSMFSKYVPAATTTVSPLRHASIADWIVGYDPDGTLRVAAIAV